MKRQTFLNQYLLAKPTVRMLVEPFSLGVGFFTPIVTGFIDYDQGRGVSVAEVRSSIRRIHASSGLAVNTQDILKKGG